MDPTLSHALMLFAGLAAGALSMLFGNSSSSSGGAAPSSTPAPTTLGGTILAGVESFVAQLASSAINNGILGHASNQHAINSAQIPEPKPAAPKS